MNSKNFKNKESADIFGEILPGKSLVFDRDVAQIQWPSLQVATKFCNADELYGENKLPCGVVLISRALLSAPHFTQSSGRVIVVGLEPKFQPYLHELAVQKPYCANWYSLDFDPAATDTTAHWYLRLPDGTRHLFAVSAEVIRQCLDGGTKARVIFAAGNKIAVGEFEFDREDFANVQALERTVRELPEYTQAELEAGQFQAKKAGSNVPWRKGFYKLATGALRKHLNCIWLGYEGGQIEMKILS